MHRHSKSTTCVLVAATDFTNPVKALLAVLRLASFAALRTCCCLAQISSITLQSIMLTAICGLTIQWPFRAALVLFVRRLIPPLLSRVVETVV